MFLRSKLRTIVRLALPMLLLACLWGWGRRRPRLIALDAQPMSLAFSHDGATLAIRDKEGDLLLWSRAEDEFSPLQTDPGPLTNPVLAMSSAARLKFSRDDRTLFASNIQWPTYGSTALYAWDMQTRQIKWAMTPSSRREDWGVNFWPSEDGKLVAHHNRRGMSLLDTSGEGTPQPDSRSKFARTFPLLTSPHQSVGEVAFSPDQKTVCAVGRWGQLKFWNVATREEHNEVASLDETVNSGEIQYSPDGRFVALFNGSTLCLWDIVAHTRKVITRPNKEYFSSFAWMPDSRSLWTGTDTVQQWSVPELKLLQELPAAGPVAVSGDGRTLATRSTTANGVWLWNIG